MKLTPDQESQVVLDYWESHPARYFSDCLTIQPKVGQKCRLGITWHQILVQKVIDEQRRDGKPVRIRIVKPRQTYISTISTANVFHCVRFHGGTAMVVSKDLDSSEHIFSIIQRYYHYLPDSEKAILRTMASNRKELKFQEPHGGRIVVETAGKTSAGHSFTIPFLHLSEVSRWPAGCDDTIIGLMNAVPDEPETMIIIESVANGMSGWFYDEWNRKDDDWVNIFLPWFDHLEYQRELPLNDRSMYETQLEDEEKRLVANFDLTLEQIEWRRWATRNNCKGDREKFREQYPATAREAFIASGNTFFHIPTLEAINTSEPLRCDLREFETLSKRKEIRPVPNPRGFLSIWKRPQPNRQYAMGVDPAEGIEVDGAPADDKHDYSSADVLDRNTGEQAAHFHARVSPDELGRQLALLGKWYSNPYVGVETNGGYGGHVLTTLESEGYSPGLFYRDYNTRKLGWTTTKANRKSLMSNLDMGIRANEVLVNNEETVNELKAFVTKSDGRIEAGSGRKDDRVFSLAIAYKMLEVAPPMHAERFESVQPTSSSMRYQGYRSTKFPRPAVSRPNIVLR